MLTSNKAILKGLHVGTLQGLDNSHDVQANYVIDKIPNGYQLYINSFMAKGILHIVPIFNYNKLERSSRYFIFYNPDRRPLLQSQKVLIKFIENLLYSIVTRRLTYYHSIHLLIAQHVMK